MATRLEARAELRERLEVYDRLAATADRMALMFLEWEYLGFCT